MIDTVNVASGESGARAWSTARTNASPADIGIATYSAPAERRSGELPWRVVRNDQTLELYIVRLREEDLGDAANASVLMGCGGALENMRLAMNHTGFAAQVKTFPNSSHDILVATLCAGESRTAGHEEEALFTTIADRGLGRTNGYSTRPNAIPAQVALLNHAARSRGCWIEAIADDCRRAMVADLVAHAAALSEAARGGRHLFSMFSVDTVSPLQLGDNDPLGLEYLFGALGGWVSPTAQLALPARVWNGAAVMEAPLIIVLGSREDSPQSWLDAGAALQRVLLHATAQHMSATFLVEPLRHPLVRDQLRDLLFAEGQPHALLRFDFADPTA